MRRLGLIAPLALAGFVGSVSGIGGFGHVGNAHAASTHTAAVCTPTGYVRDNINLTAAIINPSAPVRGTVDATGCNIGVYYGPGTQGTVTQANVFSANYFGVVNNGGNVTISHSQIHDIGEMPFNGDQHGVGIYFVDGSSATGTIDHNIVSRYQKGGIVVNGVGSSATIAHNTVKGLGPVNFIAQNGIEVGDGALATVSNNDVSGNSYTGSGAASSGGILIFGGDCYGSAITKNITVDHNVLIGNDVGIYFSNLMVDPNNSNNCLAVTMPTNNEASHNDITNSAVHNTTGNGDGTAYQAGISDQGDGDVLDHNAISGAGYTATAAQPHLYFIDDAGSNNVSESHNSARRGSSHK